MRRRSPKRHATRHSTQISNNTRAGKLFMKRFGLVTTLALCAGSAVCSAQTQGLPADATTPAPPPTLPAQEAVQNPGLAGFGVTNIRIEGLQRISEGTVYNYLPVNIGDHVTALRIRE